MRRATNRFLAFILLIACVAGVIWYLSSDRSTTAKVTGTTLVLNEVMSSNKNTVVDDHGDYPDWVELYNSTNEALDVSGYGLSDDVTVAAKWTLPNDTVIPAHGYLVVWLSGDAGKGALHATFRISSDEALILSSRSGAALDSIQLQTVESGYSLSRAVGGDTWSQMAPSPGFENTAAGAQAYLDSLTVSTDADIGVRINEFMASNASTVAGPDGSFCDWIELYNTTGAAIDLSGYGISDDPLEPKKCVLPQGTTIAGYGTLLIWCTGSENSTPDSLQVTFGLKAYGESVVFSTPGGQLLDHIDYEKQQTDKSMARVPDGTGSFTQTAQPTPGYGNNSAGVSAFLATTGYGTGDLIISELIWSNKSHLPQSDGKKQAWTQELLGLRLADYTWPDWIELYNRGASAIDLLGYALSNNAKNPGKWVLPAVTIQPGQYLLILATGNDVTDTGASYLQTNFDLSGKGGTLLLFSPDAMILDKIVYPETYGNISIGRTGNAVQYYADPTPGKVNSAGQSGVADMPAILLASGVYSGAQTVEITVPAGCTVTYTTDGSEPSASDTKYSGPFTVSDITVLRARAFLNGVYPSRIATASYFINTGAETMQNHTFTTDVISIVTDPDNLWDGDTGIYVLGNAYQGTATNWKDAKVEKAMGANFNQQGKTTERGAHFDLITSDGTLEFSSDCLIRIFGAYSRWEEQKGIAVIARSGYGGSMFQHAFFADRDYTEYKSLVLRASAMDYNLSKIRDVLIHSLIDDSDSILPTQAYRPVAVYLNGTYWGVYYIREKISTHFIAQHYGLSDPDKIEVLVGNGSNPGWVVATGGNDNVYKDYNELIAWVDSHDLSVASNYAYVCERVDVENFAEYCAMEVFVGNTDSGNIKFWRSKESDYKWRWIPYDFDWAFNREDGAGLGSTAGYRRDFFSKYFNVKGHGAGSGFSTVLSRGLLKNADFRALFLQKCAMMVNEVFTTEKMKARIDELQAVWADEMVYDTERWSTFTYAGWEKTLNNLRTTAENAPDYFLYYAQEYFGLSDSDMNRIFGRTSALDSVN